MKKILCTLMVTAAISLPALAEKGHEQDDDKGQKMGAMMGMMSHENMMAMHEHMQKMHGQMATIKHEKDPQKRQQLMQEHMQAMQEGMQMMSGGMPMGMAKNMPKDSAAKPDPMDMMKRMNMMEERMGMMQMMMGQLMDHESESVKTPVHKHKR